MMWSQADVQSSKATILQIIQRFPSFLQYVTTLLSTRDKVPITAWGRQQYSTINFGHQPGLTTEKEQHVLLKRVKLTEDLHPSQIHSAHDYLNNVYSR